jgi:hypothetical protein
MAKKPAKPQGDKPEPSEAEQTAVVSLLGEIERAKALHNRFFGDPLMTMRRYAWGTKHQERGNESGTTRTNMIYATQATLLPHIYAKNPEISVAPSEAVSEGEYEQIKRFCATAQVMLNRLFVEEARLKKRSKSNVRSTMTTSIGWLKLTYQESLSGDPIILRRHNDLQDNLQRIEHLAMTTKVEDDRTKLLEQRMELQNQMKAVVQSQEVKIFKGLALDRVQSEDVLILDESVVDFDDYVFAKKIALGIWMTDDEYQQKFGHKPPSGTTEFGQAAVNQPTDDGGKPVEMPGAAKKACYRRVWQVEDRSANMIFTVAEGSNCWCRTPYVPNPVSERFYSLFCLAFNPVEGRWRPLSDVELLANLQDEYNTTRHLYAEARKEAIPTRVFRKAGNLTEEDIKALSNRRARDWIGVEGNPSIPLNQDILQLEGIAIDADAYDVTIIRNDMDMLVGLSDASRSNLVEAKTATEAEIMRQSLMTRVAERQDTNEDFISEMAVAALEIMLQRFTPEEVRQLAGEKAVWPQLNTEEIFRKVNISVRAGSTGRPNQNKEREAWAAIMPILKDTMAQVAELRMAGNFDMADSLIELLKETLKRYDERLDIDRFIPRPELDADGNPVQQAQQAQQMQQAMEENVALKEQVQQLTEQVQQLETALQLAKNNDAERAAKAQADGAIKVAQEQARTAEASQKTEEARVGLERERLRIDEELKSKERIAHAQMTNERRIAKMKLVVEAMTKPQPGGPEGKPQAREINVDELLERLAALDAEPLV